MKRISRLISAVLALSMLAAIALSMQVTAAIANYTSLFTAGTYSDSTDINASLNYQLYVPEDYDENVSYPILVFLHGAGERGTNNTSQLTTSTMMDEYFTVERMEKYPCIILAPQCPNNMTWAEASAGDAWGNSDYNLDDYNESAYIKLVIGLMGKVEEEYNVDSTRRYITGISMGGYGTWATIMYNADVFAAAAPNCGGTDPEQAANLAGLPIWTFHGDQDTTVTLNGTRGMYDNMAELAKTNSDMKVLKYIETTSNMSTEVWDDIKDATFIYTEYAGVGHGCWDYAFNEQYFYEWMFNQSNPDAAEITNNAKCGKNYAYDGTYFDDEYTNYVSVSSSPLAAADGDLGTCWQYREKSTGETYLGVEWDNANTVDKMLIYWNKGDRATAAATGYSVQYSSDGTTWNDVIGATYNYGTLTGGAVKDVVTFDAVEAKAVRILIKSTVSSSAPKIYEMAVFNTEEAVKNGSMGSPAGTYEGDVTGIIEIEGENIAPSGTAFDDGRTVSSGMATANLNDGSRTSQWQFDGLNPSASQFPVIAGIEFETNRAANTIALYWEDGTRATSSRTGYMVEYSVDGEAWTEVPNAIYRYGTAENGVAQDVVTFTSVSAKYYRCKIMSGSNGKYYPKLYEFEIYNVSSGDDEDFGISFDADTLIATGILPGTEAGTFYSLLVKDIDGNTVNSFDKVGTGFTITYNNVDYTVVIKGDVTGDGAINSSDFMRVRRSFLGLYELLGAAELAADVSGDGDINSTDYIQIRAHFLERIDIFA